MQSLIFSLGILDSLTKPIGKIFQPLLDFVAAILAFFYSIIPNYPVSIALLTIVIMAVLTPLTVKSTKSMAAMQALGPEMKKLQQKYKGAENRAQLNEEMMKLYKEHKVNPASGCLPMLLQMPAFLVLYDVIRGITNTVQVHGHTVAQPRYISHTTKMYHDIIAGHGQLNSFGMDFAKKLLPFSSHSSIWAAIPYLLLVLASIALQYLQMSRLSKRNPAASANPQAAMLQKYMPIVFGLIYLNIPAAVNVYFIVSSAIRIGTQEVLFRRGIVGAPPARAEEKENPARKPRPGAGPKSGTGTRERPTTTRDRPTTRPKTGSGSGSGQRPSSGSGGTGSRPRPKAGGSSSTRNGTARPSGPRPAGAKGTTGGARGTSGGAKGTSGRPASARPTSGRSGTGSGTGSGNGSKSPNGTGRGRPGSPRGTAKSSGNGAASNGDSNGDESGASKAHPRSKSKRDRKAR
ncbi:MAG TPA: YidC/Oxa1 family membrane protein insertase [Acidimicrobiales bacterium]|jgi:YidC/Oxa1 family membrane protein insertase|nr:YidC/Oxa1 family membrane protein insertase [Acidimicrobiales bacterium]